MKLFELFQTVYNDYEKVGNEYYFTTPNNNKYHVHYYNIEFYYQWHLIKTVHVGFGLVKDGEEHPSDAIENTGDAFAVFSNVRHILKEIIQSNGLDTLLLAAKRSEPSRVKLYGSFVKHVAKFLPGWKLQFMTDNVYPEYRLWLLVKDGAKVFESNTKLFELFDAPLKLYKDDEEDGVYYFATKNGGEYSIHLLNGSYFNKNRKLVGHAIEVEFGRRDGKRWVLDVTNTGEQYAVFSTVLAALREYMKTSDRNYVMFVGSLKDNGRVKLYDTLAKMAEKLMPGWKLIDIQQNEEQKLYVFGRSKN